ncbi:MAG: ArnT family glycosyltransferase [Bacteroidia bacterium]
MNQSLSIGRFKVSWIYLLIGVYLITGLINLDRLPIAWNDEIQNLDPALVWHHTGNYCSPLWPNPGAENKFLSYPPLLEAWHCLWLFFGQSPWVVRLPFLLFHLLTAILLYRFVCLLLSDRSSKRKQPEPYLPIVVEQIALFITALFLFDKSTGEISRSLRVETPILLLLMGFVSLSPKLITRCKIYIPALLGLFLGSLSIAHLYTWPLVIIATTLIFNHFIHYQKQARFLFALIFLLGLIAPISIFWYAVKPEMHDLSTQLLMQTDDHSGTSLGSNVYGFFIGRFIPYYLEQPYTFFLHLIYWLGSIRLLISFYDPRPNLWSSFFNTPKKHFYNPFHTTVLIPILYLSFSIPTAIFLNPQHRYYPVQHLLGLLVIAVYLQNFKPQIHWNPLSHWRYLVKPQAFEVTADNKPSNRITPWISLICMISMLTPWTIRNSAAFLQHNQRNPNTAIEFLNKNLNSLTAGEILGEPIANYWLSQSPHPKNWKYGFEFYPQHFPFNSQKPRYFLSRTTPKQLPFLIVQDSLIIKPKFNFTQKLGHTYDGLYLYKVQNEIAWKILTSPAILTITSGH